MSSIGKKIQQVFGAAAVYKNPANYDVFTGRNLPSFIKDYLISTHVAPDGTFYRDKLTRFLDDHIPADNNAVKARLMSGEAMTLLTRFIVNTNLTRNRVEFQIPDMGIKFGDTEIPRYLVEENPQDLIDGERWGILKLVYVAPEPGNPGHVEMVKFKPFRPMEKLDIAAFRECRKQFTTEEWIDVLISAMEYDPDSFASKTQKLEFLTRLLPFVEPRTNMIELAPKGTGKSFVFNNLSKYVWLISGGKVSRAKLFYDKQKQLPGIMRFYDTVAFDEIQSISFTDGPEMQSFLKAYLEDGKTKVDNYEFMSECGLILLGNILLDNDGHPIERVYVKELPEIFKESALLDRFHGFIEGWLLPRINNSMIIRDWTINVEFFSEILHQLRTAPEYAVTVNNAIDVPNDADTRHLKAVKKLTTGYLKLLFPHVTSVNELDPEEFETYCLAPAIHRRDIIRQQCANVNPEPTFLKPMPDIRVKDFRGLGSIDDLMKFE